MLRSKELRLEHLIAGILVAYLTLHLLEEGIFGFPAWAGARWGIPSYTTGKWLLANVYFGFFLVVGYLVYLRDRTGLLAAGLGIAVWGIMNSLNHITFSAIFLEYSPGLFTGLIFLALGVLALKTARDRGQLSTRVIALSLLAGLLYWVAPMALFVSVDIALGI